MIAETFDEGLQPRRQWLRSVVFGMDAGLRKYYRVYEYSDDPSCLFRIQPAASDVDFRFTDGTRLRTGDPILALHLWNEHIPPVPAGGPTLGWARHLEQAFLSSFVELVRYLRRDSEAANIVALRGDCGLCAGERQRVRVTNRFGFEQVPDRAQGLRKSLHRSGENALTLLFALAANPQTAKVELLWRSRTHICMSRRTLESRYGAARS